MHLKSAEKLHRKLHAKRKKIVLAESDPLIVEILLQFLKPIGYEIMVVSDGKFALEAIKRDLPELIIIDGDLSGLDGFNLCQSLKSDFLTSYIPIIILIEKKQIRKRLLEIQEGIDDYILKPPDPIDLEVRIEMALRSTAHQFHASSLTRLPGNKAIEAISRTKIQGGAPFVFMYLDIDQFKSFNDTYGYLRGDGVIMQTAKILTDCIKMLGGKNDFVGHIGGDDFVIISTPEKEEAIASEIIKEFDRLIPLHYSEQDRIIGYLSVKDRQYNDIKAPLMGISIAIVNNTKQEIRNVIQLTEVASEIKKYLKTIKGSKFLINRRSTDKSKSGRNLIGNKEDKKRLHLKPDKDILPIGQLLLHAGLISEEQLTEALFEHWSSRQLLGETLIKMGLITPEKLAPFIIKC